MKCNEMESLLCLLADDELSAAAKKPVQAHIMACPGCRGIYAELLAMKKSIGAAVQVEGLSELGLTIDEEKPNRRSSFMRKKIVASLVGTIVVLGMILPAYGQTVVGNVQEWVNSLKLSTRETNYYVQTTLTNDYEQPAYLQEIQRLHVDLNLALAKARTTAEMQELLTEYNVKVAGLEQRAREDEAKYRQSYGSIQTALQNFDYSVDLPQYIPAGYALSSADKYTFNDGMTNLFTLQYSKLGVNGGKPSLTITYEYIKKDLVERTIGYQEGTVVKDTSIGEYPAIVSKFGDRVSLDVAVSSGDFKMVRISSFSDNEGELVKIAESILN